MTKYLRKNQKKILAIFSAGLMVAFALPSMTSNSTRGQTSVGTIDNGKVTLSARDYNLYHNQWQLLKRQFGGASIAAVLAGVDRLDETLVVRLMGDQQLAQRMGTMVGYAQQNPMLLQILGQQDPEAAALANLSMRGMPAFMQIEQNDDLFFLLVTEAQRMGVGVNVDLVGSVLQARGLSRDADPELYDTLEGSLRSLFMINNAAARAAGVIKVSQPELSNLLATQRQQVSLDLVEFGYKEFLDKVPAPTPEQLTEQFNKFKANEAGEGVMDFGYKYPNRVKYDAIEIPHDEVKKAIPPVELDQIWEYYLRNKNSSEFVKTNAPSTQAADAFDLNKGPTTRPMTFDEAKEVITTRLNLQRTEELANKIRGVIFNTMQADYDAYKTAVPTATAPSTAPAAKAPNSSLGVPYNSYDYLKKLRDKIQTDFKVTVTIEQQDAWQTPKSLEASRFGTEGFSNDASVTFKDYLETRVDAFLTEDQRKQLSASRIENRPLAAWEPSPVFKDSKEDQLIVRATAADPTHVPASIDEVKDKVASDVKTKQAFAKARQAAQALLDASKDKWLQTTAKAQGKKVVTTGLIRPPQPGVPPTPIQGLDMKGEAIQSVEAGAFKLLTLPPRAGEAPRSPSTQPTTQPATKTAAKPTTQPTTTAVVTPLKDHPVGLIEVPEEGKVLVAEVDQLKPIWTKDRLAYWNTGVANQQRIQIEQLLRDHWFRYDNAVERTGYVPAEKHERKPNQPLPPVSPF